MPEENTEVSITVVLKGEAQCPRCFNRLVREYTLVEEQLRTGNTTQMASYHAKALRAEIEAAKKDLLWDEKQCGHCRVKENEARLNDLVYR